MRNIKLTIQYDGTNYSGWQFQKNGRSIQETIQKTLKKITGEEIHVTGSGRTDAGVHAKAQVANFKTRTKIPLKNIQLALNSELPRDIVITRAEEAPLKFNAQHDAKSKLYCYTIMNADYLNPFIRRYAAKCFYKLDMAKMRKAARLFIGRHDFKAFRAQGRNGEGSSIREIMTIRIAKKEKLVYIYIQADGFLYKMVRNIIGTLIEVGRGKFGIDRVRELLSGKKRRLCGPAAPAKGLCLVEVKY